MCIVEYSVNVGSWGGLGEDPETEDTLLPAQLMHRALC